MVGWFDTLTLSIVELSNFQTIKPPKLAVAVSGGADSMALALWAHAHFPSTVALTVDHALRAGSAAEAAQVHRWLSARGMEHHILTWEHGPLRGNRQQQARTARYRLMAEWCRARGIGHLLVAHHQDDQAETLLLRLKRGSHITGLAAMRPATPLHGITLLRPLLATPKSTLVDYLNACGQPWLEDPSNADRAYDRNRLRALLAALPHREETVARLAATATRLGDLRRIHAQTLEIWLGAHVQWQNGNASFDAAFLEDKERIIPVLSALLVRIGASPYPPRFSSLERLHTALSQGDAARTLHRCRIIRACGQVRISREHS